MDKTDQIRQDFSDNGAGFVALDEHGSLRVLHDLGLALLHGPLGLLRLWFPTHIPASVTSSIAPRERTKKRGKYGVLIILDF